MKHEIHFFRLTVAEYENLKKEEAIDPDTLYFCSVPGGGFCLFMGDQPLAPYTAQQDNTEHS